MEGLIRQINALIRRPATCNGGGGGNKTQAFLSAFEQIVTNGSGRATRKARCWATQHGWLLILDPVSLHAALWDPVSQDRVDLPRLAKDLPRNCKCLLSHERLTSRGCVVLIVDMDRPVICYCRVTQDRWYTHEYSFEKHPNFQIQSIAAAYGDFHFAVSPTELMRMELMCYEFNPEPWFTSIEHKKIWFPRGFPWEKAPHHLVELRGKLFMFIQSEPLRAGGYYWNDVYRMDFRKREWTVVPELRDQVFLLGPSRFAASLPASELGVEESCVYLIREDKVMNIHSLVPLACFRRPYPHNPDMSGVYTLAANACGFDVAG